MSPPAGSVEAARKQRLAIDQRDVREVGAAEIQEIKGIKGHPVRPPCLERLLQGGEARNAALLLDDHLAVDQRRAELQPSQSLGHRFEAVGPVQALPGEQVYPAPVDPCLQPIAVQLDLVEPARTTLRRAGQGRGAGSTKTGRMPFLAPRNLAVLG